MENQHTGNNERDFRDSQNAEEFTGPNANFNQNTDENDRQNGNDSDGRSSDTSPHRYSNFNTENPDEAAAYETSHEEGYAGYEDPERYDYENDPAYETASGDYTSRDELEDFAPDDDRRLTIGRINDIETQAQEETGEEKIRKADEENQQFFDGL